MSSTDVNGVGDHQKIAASAGPESARSGAAVARRVGYLVAIVVNVLMLYGANNLLDWDVLPFLTEEFDRVLPAINASLGVTIAVNVMRLAYSPRWFVLATDIVSGVFSIGATLRLLQVFPFDFDRYDFPWDVAAAAILLLALVGSVIALIVNLVRLPISLAQNE